MRYLHYVQCAPFFTFFHHAFFFICMQRSGYEVYLLEAAYKDPMVGYSKSHFSL